MTGAILATREIASTLSWGEPKVSICNHPKLLLTPRQSYVDAVFVRTSQQLQYPQEKRSQYLSPGPVLNELYRD